MPSPRGVDPNAPRAGCYACYFLLTLSVASAMTPTALTLAKDLSWDVAPESSATYYGFIFAVSAMAKPFCAWASDRGRGRRRRGAHACVGCCVSAVSAVGMMTFGTRAAAAYAWGGLGSLGAAHAYASLDGHVAERSGGCLTRGKGRARAVGGQAWAMGARTAGTCAGAAASAAATAVASARRAVGLSAVWTCAAAVVAWMFVLEDEEGVKAVGASDREEAEGEDAERTERRAPTAREAMAALANVEYVKCAACVFAYRLAPTALDAFAVYTYSAFADVVPAWGYSLITFFSSVGALAAPAAFGWALTAVTRRGSASSSSPDANDARGAPTSSFSTFSAAAARLCRDARARLSSAPTWAVFVVCGVIDAALGLCRLFVVASPPSSRDTVIATLSITDVFTVFGLRVGYMPVVLLGAMAAPRNLEAFGFAGLILASDVGALVSALISSFLLRVTHVGAPTTESSDGVVSPTGRSWRALAAFLVVVAACKALVPACTAPPLLAGLSVSTDDDDEEADESADDAPLLVPARSPL